MSLTSPQLSIAIPHDSDQVTLQDTGTGGYIFTINGASRNIDIHNHDILVWVEPVQPSSPEGWYLQCPPYGIVNLADDGSWVGKGVIGSNAYPAKNGDTFNVMVTVVDRTTAAAIQIHCPYSRLYPLGTSRAMINNLVVKIK